MLVQHIFWASPNSSGIGNGRVAKLSPWFGIVPNRQHGGLGMPSLRGVIRRVQDMLATEVCTLITYLGHDCQLSATLRYTVAT